MLDMVVCSSPGWKRGRMVRPSVESLSPFRFSLIGNSAGRLCLSGGIRGLCGLFQAATFLPVHKTEVGDRALT
jgi:hypothetical protein